MRRRSQPGEDLPLSLAPAALFGQEAGLLEGVLDLVVRSGRMPRGYLRAQLRAEVACRDPGE